jgi:hypothetical protein
MDFKNATCVTLTDRGLKNFWLSDSFKDQLKARTLCRGCPVQMECAVFAEEINATCGVWAGQLRGTSYEADGRKRVSPVSDIVRS